MPSHRDPKPTLPCPRHLSEHQHERDINQSKRGLTLQLLSLSLSLSFSLFCSFLLLLLLLCVDLLGQLLKVLVGHFAHLDFDVVESIGCQSESIASLINVEQTV